VTAPRETLAPLARTLWRVTGAGVVLPTAAVAFWAREAFELPLPAPALWGLTAVALAAAVGVVPGLRWRRWRYEVREREIDLCRGVVTERRTLVPIERIQHVDTARGPLQRVLGLATVAFHTAAGRNEIPHLAIAEAERLRRRIAELTRTPDEL
jgi:membrane protein YdbS with pleckstrin-like domain